jgi:hypothetical protein
LGEQIVQTEETLHGNQEESRQEKETLSGPMLVQQIPQASQEKHLLRGFSVAVKAALIFRRDGAYCVSCRRV